MEKSIVNHRAEILSALGDRFIVAPGKPADPLCGIVVEVGVLGSRSEGNPCSARVIEVRSHRLTVRLTADIAGRDVNKPQHPDCATPRGPARGRTRRARGPRPARNTGGRHYSCRALVGAAGDLCPAEIGLGLLPRDILGPSSSIAVSKAVTSSASSKHVVSFSYCSVLTRTPAARPHR